MITRRTFVKTLPALGAALAAEPELSSPSDDASKVSLIVGNSAYPRMQLRNSVNDARAVSDLLASAGFSVDIQLEATQRTFMDAIQRFGRTVKRGGTKLAVFYYAGHGVQLDWRNYLPTRLEWRFWYVPGLNFAVKWENIARRFYGEPVLTNRFELVTLRQQKTGLADTEAFGATPTSRAG
jgi:hypothetical protein